MIEVQCLRKLTTVLTFDPFPHLKVFSQHNNPLRHRACMSCKSPKIMALYSEMIVQKYFGIVATLNISNRERLGFLHMNNHITVLRFLNLWLLHKTAALPVLGSGWRPESWWCRPFLSFLSSLPPSSRLSADKYFSKTHEIKGLPFKGYNI